MNQSLGLQLIYAVITFKEQDRINATITYSKIRATSTWSSQTETEKMAGQKRDNVVVQRMANKGLRFDNMILDHLVRVVHVLSSQQSLPSEAGG